MKTLEGQEAIDYLDRLTATLVLEARDADRMFQGVLLLTLLRLEKAFFESARSFEMGEGPQLLITDSGFPSIPTTLVHANRAIESIKVTTHVQKKLAIDWLEAIASLSHESLEKAHKLVSAKNPLQNASQIVNNLTADQTAFLKNTRRLPEQTGLPFFTSDNRPGVLLAKDSPNPFSPNPDAKDFPRPFTAVRKYIDSDASFPNLPIGNVDDFVDPNNPPKHPRLPILLTGYALDDQKTQEIEISSRKILASTKSGIQEIISGTALALQNEFRTGPDTITEALLSLDLTTLDQEQTDQIINSFETIKKLSGWLFIVGYNLSGNHVDSSSRLVEFADQLLETIKNVPDSAAQKAFQLALKKKLQPVTIMLTEKEEPQTKTAAPVKKPKRGLLSNIFNREN